MRKGKMADDLQTNLSSYKLQLQQVEAALTSDPSNEDLNKLKKDLQEVIDLTQDLISQSLLADQAAIEAALPPKSASAPAASSSSAASSSVAEATAVAAALAAASNSGHRTSTHWKPGDKCLALYSEDGGTYEAVIDEILDDGTCSVTFESYGNTDVTEVALLKPLEDGSSPGDDSLEGPSSKKPKTKRDKLAAEREYKKKKQQKKAQRMKTLEEEREVEKNKWLDFNSKVFSKTTKGKVKKSIFATPDCNQGRVGVGTCGVSGKPMTSYTQQEKWKK